tara:strand:+ start:3433 stop:4314 length:882 start_codon:yes stop_codon:yes gene_type:complete
MSATSNSNALKTLTAILTFLLLGLGIYTIKFYNQVQSNEVVLIREKEMIEGELKDILKKYNDEIAETQVLQTELLAAKERIQGLLDTLKESEATQVVLQNYRIEIRHLRSERDVLLQRADSLTQLNEALIAEKTNTEEAFGETIVERDSLQVTNLNLQKEIEKGSQLTISNLEPAGVIVRSSGKQIENSRARRIDDIEICFTINENPLAKTGEHTIFLQIINPQNNVIGAHKTQEFGEDLLIYSASKTINYSNAEMKMCILATSTEDSFEEGLYQVNIFEDARLLRSAVLELN